MRGDGGQWTDTHLGDGPRERGGPRHAAPRKSLLTKLHLPSGKKAFALAAMPTAVFVGMGLTPKLALADDGDIPFAPGPCVTRSDEPSASPEPETTPSPSATTKEEEPAKGGAPDGGGTPGEGGATSPSPSPSGSADGAGPGPDDGEAAAAGEPARTGTAAEPSATPTPTRSKNPLDPLGVGDALRDLFKIPPKDGDRADDGAGEPTAPAPDPSAGPEDPEPDRPAAGNDAPGDGTDRAAKTADRTAEAIREAAGRAGRTVEELDEGVKGLDPVKDEAVPDGAKPRFPCPVPDPDALAAAELEPGMPLLPADPWTLESSLLTLNGLDYHGIVEVKKADGSIKKVLKFTASSIDIKDLHQLTVGPAGTTGHVTSRPGSTSTIRGGEVTMYTEELKGNLFGLIPITFSPESPPPLNVPFAFFTKVTVTQAGQFGGTLTVPGLSNYLEGGRS